MVNIIQCYLRVSSDVNGLRSSANEHEHRVCPIPMASNLSMMLETRTLASAVVQHPSHIVFVCECSFFRRYVLGISPRSTVITSGPNNKSRSRSLSYIRRVRSLVRVGRRIIAETRLCRPVMRRIFRIGLGRHARTY